MDKEYEKLGKILKNERLLQIVNNVLIVLMNKLINEFEFDKPSFFSDNISKFGNIGYSIDDTDLDNKLKYLLSKESTIREKITAITNSIVSGADQKDKSKDNTMILYAKMITTTTPNPWIILRKQQCKFILHKKYLDQSNTDHLTRLWAPIYYIYPNYKIKHDLTNDVVKHGWIPLDKEKSNNSNHVSAIAEYKTTPIKQSDLNEKLSIYEKKFLKLDQNTNDDDTELPWITGKYIYRNNIHLLPEYKFRDKSIIIGGISGHTILLLELANIADINWIPIMFGCIISQIPHHHSIAEIFDAIKDINLVHKILNMDMYNENNYLTFFDNMAQKINVSL